MLLLFYPCVDGRAARCRFPPPSALLLAPPHRALSLINNYIPTPSTTQVMAGCGFDSICVDMQHNVQDYMSTIACFQGMSAKPVVHLVRVPRCVHAFTWRN
ncbi:hypothetical protein M427DRAFT_54851 [Gonapodya prolifera JEL478]|uniref:HpcH/HpaI aldolase/citrate lyase domain-containing protein n=1 Tax=Gonapodya prolifera (strain JEL478) TaxID=1344416 RepID=A0A139AK93_GONPJ|nr:hypothetical protein M427DRAFT_54851 [Gonapodya prolifera JEL478]|eukprot:KXS17201.1 hypothetical protein M427DRAFT_54851 [Gonapodya prolifera JEL478]